LRRRQAVPGERRAAAARRPRRDARRPRRRPLRAPAAPLGPADRMAVTPGVRLVAIGPPLALVDDDAAAVATALAAGGVADERLALLPQGAIAWTDGEPAWALETDAAAWVVLPRGGLGAATTDSLIDFARARLGRGGAVAARTLRTAGVALADVETRLAAWL